MFDIPIWNQCKQCTRFAPQTPQQACPDPFPPSGVCPHPNDRLSTLDHPYLYQPDLSHKYAALLVQDSRLSSIFQRWRRGDLPKDKDFLYIREQILDPARFLVDDNLLFFIYDILFESAIVIASDFAAYYLGRERPPEVEGVHDADYANQLHPIMEKIQGCLGLAVISALPMFLQANKEQGGEWTRFVLDMVRYVLWHQYKCQHIDFSKKSDSEFRVQFEREWKLLCRYHDIFYGFRVVPKLSLSDMVRYQKLAKGDVTIRREISVYLTHQATEYPHWIKKWCPNFTEVGFERRIRESYSALVKSMAKVAAQNLTSAGKDRTVRSQSITNSQQLEQDIENQLWQQFDAARKEFTFYWDYPGKERPLGKIGFVDFPQDREARDKVDASLKALGLPYGVRDFSEVGFAHFIQDRLRRWVKAHYPADAPHHSKESLDQTPADGGPALGETLAGDNSWNIDDSTTIDTKPAVVGKDGIPYITIHQAAERSGMTVHQLRRLDREGFLPSVRVKDVCEKPWTLNADVRLYPLTAEGDQARQVAKARLTKHSSRLAGEEVDRQTAATIVGVTVAALRKWETLGLVQAKRKGKIIVYDAEALEQARQAKAHMAG